MKKLKLVIALTLITICLSACNANKDTTDAHNQEIGEIYGQDIVRYSTLYDTDSELSYELPIVCKDEIKDFLIEGYTIVGEGSYIINDTGLSGGEKYKDWYYYFANITVGIECKEAADFEIKAVVMNINGESINYDVDNMYFTNIKAKYEDRYLPNIEALVYENGGPAHILGEIADDYIHRIDFKAEENCIIHEIGYLDFIDIDTMEVELNGETVEFNSNLSLNKDDFVSFKFKLKYKNGVTKNNIVKTSFFVKYTYDEKDYLFVDEQGVIIINSNEDQFMKDYIDEVSGGV